MVVPDAPMYGIPPARPNTTYGFGTACATAFVIPSCSLQCIRTVWIGANGKGAYECLLGRLYIIDKYVPAGDGLGEISGRLTDFFSYVLCSMSQGLGTWAARYRAGGTANDKLVSK